MKQHNLSASRNDAARICRSLSQSPDTLNRRSALIETVDSTGNAMAGESFRRELCRGPRDDITVFAGSIVLARCDSDANGSNTLGGHRNDLC